MIKQPTIILGSSSILIITIGSIRERKIREAFRLILGFLLGFLGLVAVVSVYWMWLGAFDKLIDGAFLQGISFIGGSESHLRENFFYTLVNVIPNLLIGRLYLIAMLAAGFFLIEKLYQFWVKPVLKTRLSIIEWCGLIVFASLPMVGKQLWPNIYFGKFWLISIFAFGLYFLVKFYRLQPKLAFQNVFSPVEWTWLIAVVSLPLEVLMVSLGGRYLGHYFITMLPAVMITIAYPIYRVVSSLRESLKSKGALLRYATYLIMMVSCLVLGSILLVQDMPSAINQKDIAGIFREQVSFNKLEQYIIQTTKPDDEVLVWHIHLGINFITDRKAPSRFLFPVNLFIPPSDKNTKLEEYIKDLENKPPELILVQKPSSLSVPFVDDPLDSLCRIYCSPEFEQAIKIPQIRQDWLRLQNFFYANYILDTRIYDWTVYRKLP